MGDLTTWQETAGEREIIIKIDRIVEIKTRIIIKDNNKEIEEIEIITEEMIIIDYKFIILVLHL